MFFCLCALQHFANTLMSLQQPVIVPGDAHDVVALKGRIGICADRGIHIFDLEQYEFPTFMQRCGVTDLSLSMSAVENIIPNLSDAGESAPMRLLQERIAKSKPLGLVRSGPDELLVVFNGMLIWYYLLLQPLISS